MSRFFSQGMMELSKPAIPSLIGHGPSHRAISRLRPCTTRVDHSRHPPARPADFDAVAEAAAARNRWEFMLTIAPLRIPRGTGSPVNPIAMF
jgi:hypothetical protein